MTLGVSSPIEFEKMEVNADVSAGSFTRSLHPFLSQLEHNPFLKASAAEATANQSLGFEEDGGRKLEALQDLAADFLKMVKDEQNKDKTEQGLLGSTELKTQSLFRTVPTSMAKPPLGQSFTRKLGPQRQSSLRFRTTPPERVDIPRAVAIPPNMFSPSMTLESPILLRSSQVRDG
jgi:hypothetical protein